MQVFITRKIQRKRLNLRKSLKVKFMKFLSMRTENSILKKQFIIITVSEIHYEYQVLAFFFIG
jgi:hypothetical protein